MNCVKKLNKLWQQKLKDNGFVDIENDYGMLHSWDSFRFAAIDPDHFFAVREKYLEAGQLESLFDIRSELERNVWLHYCDGLSYRDIAKLVGRNKDHVQKIVWKLNSILKGLMNQHDRQE
jgi:DNA-directed RNA polymerase specialized sigma24 family protein